MYRATSDTGDRTIQATGPAAEAQSTQQQRGMTQDTLSEVPCCGILGHARHRTEHSSAQQVSKEPPRASNEWLPTVQ